MEYTSEFDNTNNICTVRVTGKYYRERESEKLKRFAVDFHAENGCCLFIFDMTQAEIVATTMETFEAAAPRPDIFRDLIKIKTAFLYRVITDEERFMEDVAVNRGLQAKLFDVYDKAVEWLEQS